MDSAVDLLIKKVETEPNPTHHTSSHWIQYGNQVGGRLEAIYRPHPVTRFFKLLDRISYRPVTQRLQSYPPVWKTAKRLVRDLSAGLTFNVFKSAAALALLLDHWQEHRLSPRTFLLIGDGAGFLGALLRRLIPSARIYSVDLPRMLLIQAGTYQKADPAVEFSISPEAVVDQVTFVFPEELERIPERIDCAVSIASMQEMTTQSIASYFAFLRRQNSGPGSIFYCVSRQRKVLPAGEVSEFSAYPWSPHDTLFIDGECPYYTHFFSHETSERGPKVFGLRVPFLNFFDGPMNHRLVRLSPIP